MKTKCAILLFLLIAPLSGCSEISVDYGKSRGYYGRNSLNGFGGLRSAYEEAGFRSRDVTRLSDRVARSDVIVWTPMEQSGIDGKVTRWFESWLRRGGKTLVYVIPDSGSEVDYWTEAARLAEPEQRLEYRKRAGQSINERIQWRLNRSGIPTNGWFRVESLEKRVPIADVEGPWENVWADAAQTVDDGEADGSGVEMFIVAHDPDQQNATANTGKTGPIVGVTGPGSMGWAMPVETDITKVSVEYSPLASIEDQPIVGEVTSSQWRDSRIIVVAGGSLLTNFSFTREPSRRLADQVIEASTPKTPKQDAELLAGFLTSQSGEVPVSERTPDTPQATGMEMLSQWPISLVTMHGVILGMVVCLMLLPIFGRPRKIRRSETNDFGHHLDAVAALMKRAGGERYARGRISDYFKRMHGETTGRWVLPDVNPAASSSPVPATSGQRLTSRAEVLSHQTNSDEAAKSDANSVANPDAQDPTNEQPSAGDAGPVTLDANDANATGESVAADPKRSTDKLNQPGNQQEADD